MNYKKQSHTRLHHIEIHPHDDGSYGVEAHLIHRPPAEKGKGPHHMNVVPSGEEYPNKRYSATAESHEEAAEHVKAIAGAHKHEKVRRGGGSHADLETAAQGGNGNDEYDEEHANYE